MRSQLKLIGFITLTLLIAISVIRCGGGGGGESSATAPSISSFTILPSAVYVNEGGGQTSISGTFQFTDPEGDLSSAILTVLDSGGQNVMSESISLAAASGITSGTLQGSVTIATTVSGNFTIQLYITDASALRSNTLESDFRISEFPWATKSAMPTPRLEISTATINGLIYVIGGRDVTAPIIPRPVIETVEVYDPAADSWTTGPSLPVAAAEQMTIAIDSKIYAIGGEAASFNTNVVQVFDSETQTWTQKTVMPDYRSSAAISVYNNLIYIAGGKWSGVGAINSLLWYDPALDTWGAGAPMNQSREGAGGATIDGKILVYGGYGLPGMLGSLESYDPTLDTWSIRAGSDSRESFGVSVFDNLMYVFGGFSNSGPLDTVNAYNYNANLYQWLYKTPMPSKLGFVRAETIGDKIYVFDTYNTLEYTPSNDIR